MYIIIIYVGKSSITGMTKPICAYIWVASSCLHICNGTKSNLTAVTQNQFSVSSLIVFVHVGNIFQSDH